MKIFILLKQILKKESGFLYKHIRNASHPIYFRYRQFKLKKFHHEEFVSFNHNLRKFLISVNPDNGFVDNEIFFKGVYEEDVLSVIEKHLKEGDVFIDVGANIGQHSLYAAQIVGIGGQVISFEPIKRITEQFQGSIYKNNLENIITVYNYGLSDRDEERDIYIKEGNTGGSSLYKRDLDVKNKEKIKLVNGDGILNQLKKISFIKIDTEGHEYSVLNGINQTIKTHLPIILFEYSPSFFKNTEQKSIKKYNSIIKSLISMDYSLYDINNGDFLIEDIERWVDNFSGIQTDILAMPK